MPDLGDKVVDLASVPPCVRAIEAIVRTADAPPVFLLADEGGALRRQRGDIRLAGEAYLSRDGVVHQNLPTPAELLARCAGIAAVGPPPEGRLGLADLEQAARGADAVARAEDFVARHAAQIDEDHPLPVGPQPEGCPLQEEGPVGDLRETARLALAHARGGGEHLVAALAADFLALHAESLRERFAPRPHAPR